jgi:hypothetical protein
MNKTYLKHDILVVEDFLSADECARIIKWMDFIVEKGIIKWNPISFYESYAMGFFDEDYFLQIFGFPKDYMRQLKEKVKIIAEEVIGEPAKEITFHTQKWIPGAFAGFHSDNSKDGQYNAFERSRYAGFLYLNDDFEGGALNFKDHPITIQPKTGMLVMFNGSHENEHEVQLVKKSDRYTIGSFWDKASNTYSQETLDRWEAELAQTRGEQSIQQKEWKDLKDKGISVSPRPEGIVY